MPNPKGRIAKQPFCAVPGCGRKHAAKGYCSAHWQRLHHGKPIEGKAIGDKFGANNPKWRGGEITDGHGRVLIYSPNHPNPSYCGSHVYRYRLVMEAHLGRFLLPTEIVHHINGVKDDDRIENLEVMTQSKHASLHFTKGDKWAFSADCCANCGTTERPHEGRGLCGRCYGIKNVRAKHRRTKGVK